MSSCSAGMRPRILGSQSITIWGKVLCHFASRACLGAGKEVTSCSMEFFRKVKATCAAEFMTYVNCMEKSSGDMQFYECRKTQGIFDKCMQEKMGLERPHYGYHCLPKVLSGSGSRLMHTSPLPQIHDTDRPAPKEEKPAWMDNDKVIPVKLVTFSFK